MRNSWIASLCMTEKEFEKRGKLPTHSTLTSVIDTKFASVQAAEGFLTCWFVTLTKV